MRQVLVLTRRARLRLAGWSVGLLIGTGVAAAAPTYRITNLGTLQGAISQALAINDAGTVVGVSGNEAFRWTAAQHMTALPRTGPSAAASGIDSKGRIVGAMSDAAGDSLGVAWRPAGDVLEIADPGSGFVVNVNGVNDRRQAVGGVASVARFRARAVLWSPGETIELGSLSNGPRASAQALAINNRGVVVGQSTVGADELNSHAFVWQREAGMHDLGTLVASDTGFSIAYDINDDGVAVGSSSAASGQFAFSWTLHGGMRSLGSLPGSALSEAYGINGRGRIVGRAFVGDGNHGFLWIRGEGMHDLNQLIDSQDPLRARTVVEWANDINDRGQIVGIGVVDGETRALLLTPIAD